MTSLLDGRGNTSTFGYDPDGNLTRQADANGLVQTSTYDADDVQVSSTDTAPRLGAVATYAVTRDNDEQVSASHDTVLGITASHTYTYTPADRVGSDNTGNYGYDPAGNLTAQPAGTVQTYDAADELTSQTQTLFGQPLTTSYTNSVDGQRTSAIGSLGSTAYTYDQTGQLTSLTTTVLGATLPASSYTYNGDALRTTSTTSGTTARFTYDLTSPTEAVLTDGTNSYLYGPTGNVLEQINTKTGQTLYLSQDQLGSTRLITNQAGLPVGALTYSPYGKATFLTGLQRTWLSPIGYAGAYTDTSTGLLYLIHRYYDTTTGTFLTPDPLTTLTGQPYGYTAGNPLNDTDPLGLWPCLSVHCLANDAGQAAGAVSAVTALVPGLEEVSEGAALFAVAADIVSCATGACDYAALGLDVLSLAPGAAALRFASRADQDEAELKVLGALRSLRPSLENDETFQKLYAQASGGIGSELSTASLLSSMSDSEPGGPGYNPGASVCVD